MRALHLHFTQSIVPKSFGTLSRTPAHAHAGRLDAVRCDVRGEVHQKYDGVCWRREERPIPTIFILPISRFLGTRRLSDFHRFETPARAPGRSPEEEEELHNANPPIPCLWQAPARHPENQKENQAGHSAIRRSARGGWPIAGCSWNSSPRVPNRALQPSVAEVNQRTKPHGNEKAPPPGAVPCAVQKKIASTPDQNQERGRALPAQCLAFGGLLG